MEVKPGYKQSEVGVIPEEWECPRIRDAAAKSSNATVGGPFGSDLVSADYVDSGVPVIRGQNMSFSFVTGGFVFVSEKKARSLSANLAHPKDLVFTQRGTLGQVAIVPDGSFESYLISQSQMKVSLDRSRHDPLFLHQYFTSAVGQKQIVISAIQTGVPHTNLGILRAYRFPAPPLPEQRAIATALSDVDGLLGGLDRLIAKKRDLKHAAMQQLLTGQTRLPGFRGEWEVKSIRDVGSIQTGPFGTLLKAHEYSGSDGVPLISVGEVGAGRFRITEDTPRVPKNVIRRLPQYVLRKGDIVFGRKGAVDRSALITDAEDGWFLGSDGIRLRPADQCHPPYLAWQFQRYEVQVWLLQNAIGTTMASLNQGILNRVQIPYAPLPEQTAIASVLTEMDGELAVLEQRREKTRALKQAMMQELLTGRTRLV